MKAFVGGLMTETNTFSSTPTTRASFEGSACARGREAVMNQPLFRTLVGPLEAAIAAMGLQAHFGLLAFAQPGGVMAQSDYVSLRDNLLDDLRSAAPVAAVLLSLHGAMVAQETWDCEGDMLARVREIVGSKVPVVAVLDPHAHLTETMVANASLMAFMKEYPHTDAGARWAEMLKATFAMLNAKLKPVAAVVDCELIGFWPTQAQPIRGLIDLFYAAEKRAGVISASFVHGFPWGDTPETGSKVLVYTDDNPALAREVAEELAAAVIATREASRIVTTPIAEALDMIGDDGLTVLADWADNPGGGAPSDATFILRAILDRGLTRVALGLFFDPELVQRCFAAGVGGKIAGKLGGTAGMFSGAPVDFSGVVRGLKREAVQQMLGSLSDRMGDAAWIQFAGLDVIVAGVRTQCHDPSAFAALGLDVRQHRAVVVKSSNHFHQGFAPLAKRIVIVDTPGTLSADFANLPYQRLTKPRWPRNSV